MKNLFLTSLLALCAAITTAQQCRDFDCAYREAQRLLDSKQDNKYTKAMAHLDDAEAFAGQDKAQNEKIRALRKKVFVAIEKERKEAVEARDEARREREIAGAAERKAREARWEAQQHALNALQEKFKAEESEKKARAVLDKIYFYDDRFGLAYDKNTSRYGFIDKNLNTKIDFKYLEAQPFEYTGFAKIKKYDIHYLIDTTGKEYKLATDVAQLDDSITALDLRGKKLDSIPPDVWEYTQMYVLMLNNNQLTFIPAKIGNLKNLRKLDLFDIQLTNLPAEIGKLQNLRALDLGWNQLTTLPAEIGELQNLRNLDLGGNPIPPSEQEKIRKLLPNCTITF